MAQSEGKMFVFYTNYHHKSHIPTPNASGDTTTSEICTVTMFIIPMAGSEHTWRYSDLQWHNVHTNFHENPSVIYTNIMVP
jgi:hypothetical protein